MNTERKPFGWRFWILWVSASTVSLALGLALVRIAATLVLFFVNSMIGGGLLGAIPGALMGLVQWGLLRGHVVFSTGETYRWSEALLVLVKWLGQPLFALFDTKEKGEPVYLREALTNTADKVTMVFGVLGGWAVASTVGLAIGGAAVLPEIEAERIAMNEGVGLIVFGAVLGASIGIAQWFVLRRKVSQPGWWVLVSLVGGVASIIGSYVSPAIGIPAYGLITGSAMVWLLRRPRRDVFDKSI